MDWKVGKKEVIEIGKRRPGDSGGLTGLNPKGEQGGLLNYGR